VFNILSPRCGMVGVYGTVLAAAMTFPCRSLCVCWRDGR